MSGCRWGGVTSVCSTQPPGQAGWWSLLHGRVPGPAGDLEPDWKGPTEGALSAATLSVPAGGREGLPELRGLRKPPRWEPVGEPVGVGLEGM